jgi:Ca2+-binding EF-hand superfamily protein
MEHAFAQWDLDKDNKLTYQDIHNALQLAGLPHQPQDVHDMISGLDPNNTGHVSLEQFKLACQRKLDRGPHQRPHDTTTDLDRHLHRKK